MKRFLGKILLFVLIAISAFSIPFYLYMRLLHIDFKNLPAPRFSNSFTFNEKMGFMRGRNVDVLALGGSGTLNNLYSPEIVSFFNTTSYLNTGSWGICPEDSYKMLQMYCQIHKPKSVLLVADILDYSLPSRKVDLNDLKLFLTTDGLNKIYFKYTNFYYILSEMKEKRNALSEAAAAKQMNMRFDPYGAVLIKKDTAQINFVRHDKYLVERDKSIIGKVFTEEASHEYARNFEYLDSLSIYCKINNIKLYYFEGVLRSAIYPMMGQALNKGIEEHCKKVQKVLVRDGHQYVNSNDKLWADSLFYDNEHMNIDGAKLFTQNCLDKCK